MRSIHPLRLPYLSSMRTTIFSTLFALLFFSCQEGRQVHATSEAVIDHPNAHMIVTSFSVQDHYPGVYSNLRMTRNYNMELSTSLDTKVEYLAVLFDSIQLPITFISVDGEDRRPPFTSLAGRVENLNIYTSRNFYQSEAPKSVSETNYALSGKQLDDDESFLLYKLDGMPYMLPLGAPKKIDPMYGR